MPTQPPSADSPEAPDLKFSVTPAEHATGPIERTIHIVIMSKGGVGKTLIAWNLIQYLQQHSKGPVSAIDLDPMSHSLAEYAGLGARKVDLMAGPDLMLNGADMDALSEDLLLKDTAAHTVLDNGAAGFVGLIRYLVDHDFASLLAEHQGRLIIHAVMGGGSSSAQCLLGLDTLLREFSNPKIKFVGWINNHEGPFTIIDKQGALKFEDMALYKDHKEQFLGLIYLARLHRFFLDDLKMVQAQHLTYSEAISSPGFLLMNKQRLAVIRRDIWAQLDRIGLLE
jgi:hypothetical protein